MKKSWQHFFNNYPDYAHHFTQIKYFNDKVVIRGYSTCSYKPLAGLALWTAKVKKNKITEWRVYEDNKNNRKDLGLPKN